MMKILLFGKNGQVGWELQRSLAPLGHIKAMDRAECDLSSPAQLQEAIRSYMPDVMVNAAAYTAVDKAESEQDKAFQINRDAPALMAREAAAIDALLVHYSTDYVFDGSGSDAWQETDQVNPLNVYGTSKLAGEQAIHASHCRHLIFRTSWVYAARGQNFAQTMLRLAQERDSLSVINDQFGAPTSAELIADVTSHAICSVQDQPELAGLYHLVAQGVTTWYDYARVVLDFARSRGMTLKVSKNAVTPVSTSAFPTPARRPRNSRLDCGKLEKNFHLTLPFWQDSVGRMLTEILEKHENTA